MREQPSLNNYIKYSTQVSLSRAASEMSQVGTRRPLRAVPQRKWRGTVHLVGHKDGGQGGGASEEPGREIYHFILMRKQESTWHFTREDQTGLRDLTLIAGWLFVPADSGGGEWEGCEVCRYLGRNLVSVCSQLNKSYPSSI